MGKKVRKQAQKLGFTNLPVTELYARARKIKTTFSKYVPDVARVIYDYIMLQDPSMLHDRSGGGRNNSYYYLSEKLQLYVEVFDKAAGFVVANPSNHAIQIKIYTKDEDLVRTIANAVNSIYVDADGMLAHMDWRKIEKKFKVKRDDCIATWKKFLN
ncbi:MAG: hypothetical protein ACTSYB_05705 [Candidatus Helarchaeota archaeon]